MIAGSVFGQSIIQPKGKTASNTTVPSGSSYHFYDDGGANGTYTKGTNSVITIYPSTAGEYVTINCNSFELKPDCRMYIFDGNHPGAPIIGYYEDTKKHVAIKAGNVFTASAENPSGALSIRFKNVGRYTPVAGWDFTVTTTKSSGPAPRMTTQDCSGAIKVCSDSAITTKSSGYNFQELPGGGFWNSILNYGGDGENQSNWYKFEVATPGTIEFLIRPHSNTDFDWALWGPYRAHECPAWTTDRYYRASACDGKYSQVTGLSTTATDLTEGSGGDGYVAAINVRKGEHYIIMIDDWSGNHTTFDLTWKFTKGASLECAKDEEPAIIAVEIDTVEIVESDPCVVSHKLKVKGTSYAKNSEEMGRVDVRIEGGKEPYAYKWTDNNGKKFSTQKNLLGAEKGKYVLEVTDANGCVISNTFLVDEKIDPEVVEDSGPKLEAEISIDQSFVTVSYPGAFEYKIENVNEETVITGHAVSSDEVEITRLPPGTYRVSLIYKRIKQYTTFVKN